ncbi:MAG: transcription termination factor Rho [Gemmatimonadota bacterium]
MTAPTPTAALDAAPAKKPRGRPKKTAVADAAPTEAPPAPPPVVSSPPVAAAPAVREPREPRAPRAPRAERADRTAAAAPAEAPRAETPRVESAPAESFDGGDRGATQDRSTSERPERGADRNGDRPQGGDRNERRGRFQRRRGRGRNRFRDGVDGADAPSAPQQQNAPRNERGPRPERNERPPRNERHERGPRPERGERQERQNTPETPGSSIVTAEATITGWYDPARGDGGFIRRGAASYLPQPGDPFIPGWMARQFQLRRADLITALWGHDQRRRPTVCEITTLNEMTPDPNLRRKDFKSLTASYPNKRLTLETGRPAKVGPEITRRAIDLIAPIGYGQRALIVAPARAGKTTLLQAITEGVHLNHPDAVLMLLLVDERPEEVSEAISWDVGEVIASSFDQPAQRHVDVTEIVTERAHRLVEMGKDVVIVLDSITRMGRAFNTANRGTGRTMSGGLDANAMAKPKAFFGSARNVAPEDGGGSLTIIATALVETGSRMDDVIFEEFKGTGNCEIKLDRGLAERRIFPAIDIPASGTRREEKLYKPEQVQSIYMLRRGLQQMPPMGAMEWLIKRIAATANNDALLAGL